MRNLPILRLRFAVLTLVISTFTTLGANLHASAADHPNIVVILVDDMGYGDPGCFNPDSKIETPNIDALATAGMKFNDAHAPGALCHISRYGLLTGTYPMRSQINVWPRQAVIKKDEATIASLLKANGYHTAMVGKWHLGFDENGYDKPLPGGPADRGFDSFFGIRASTDIPPYFYIRNREAVKPPTDKIEANHTEGWTNIQGEFWRAGGISPDLELKDVLPRFSEEAVKVIDDHAANTDDKPLFLYVAFPAPHTPWLPSEEFRGKSKVPLYGDFAMMVDHHVGRVLAALKKNGMEENTLVIFSSDNGPVWYEEDEQRFDHQSVGKFRGMKADAWEGGHRMPFIARWPAKVKPGSQSAQVICFTDLMATFADLVDADMPKTSGRDSFSFLPVLVGEQPETKAIRASLVHQSGNGTLALRKGKWKLITALGSGGFSKPGRENPKPDGPRGQLYDLQADPEETTNLWLKKPDVVEQLTAELNQIRKSPGSRTDLLEAKQ